MIVNCLWFLLRVGPGSEQRGRPGGEPPWQEDFLLREAQGQDQGQGVQDQEQSDQEEVWWQCR